MAGCLLTDSLEQALNQIAPDMMLAVALSGGPDSSALAVFARAWAQRHQRMLWLLHVHHGLQQQADAWASNVETLARLLDCKWDVRHVTVDLTSGHGLEGAARQARYEALKSMAAEHGIGVILLAHHQKDQAETVLIRLLRGSGVTGLAAMTPVTERDGLYWVRPWLTVPRELILDELSGFSERTGWLPVDDPSNIDSNTARGTLRAKVIPAIQSHWPGWQQTLARHAQQAAEADRLLRRYGQELLANIALDAKPGVVPTLSLARWRDLEADEQVLVLRTWLEKAGAQMPTERRLAELLRQLREVHALGHDRDLKWTQRDCLISCVRGQLHLTLK